MIDKKIYKNPDITVWELTLECNLKCLHCGSSAGVKRADELTTKEALKLCHDLSDIGFKGIALMGGEVFLRKDWPIISKEIKDLGMINIQCALKLYKTIFIGYSYENVLGNVKLYDLGSHGLFIGTNLGLNQIHK